MIIIPRYNGEAIFGDNVVMNTPGPDRDRQMNSYIGIDGVECLDFGSRGYRTTVTGRLVGFSPGEVGLYESRFRNYIGPYAYPLLTTDGILWPDVFVETFRPQGRLMGDYGTGEFWRAYQATFFHLI